MQTAIKRQPGSKVALTVTVEPEMLQEGLERVFQKRARKVNVPGFRPGKAPRRLIEERLAPLAQAMEQEAVEAAIDSTYKTALSEQKLEPLERGEIEDLNVSDDKSLTYTVLVSVRPEVKLPEYTGIDIKKPVTTVSDEQVLKEIENLRERTADFSEIADEGISAGDYVTIDYTMSIEGNPYPEGDATGYPLEVGSDSFFPELNEGLLGLKQGENTTISKSYPEDYTDKQLAGKSASFDITIQQVRRMVKPEATDEWVNAISQGALANLDELKERIKTNLQAMANQADQDQVRNELVRKIVEGAELELPDTLVEEETEHLMHELEHRLSQQRMSMQEYSEATNRSEDDIRNDQLLMARDMVRRSLVLQEIARKENISVTDEDINASLESFTKEGGSVKEIRTALEKAGRIDSLVSKLFHEKVLTFLENNAKIEMAENAGIEAMEETAPAKKPRKKAKPTAKEEEAE